MGDATCASLTNYQNFPVLLITKIILNNFRNFSEKKITFSKPLILFSGANGVGKTNILEAITVLGKTTNLRNSSFEEMLNNNENNQNFSLYIELKNHDLIDNLAFLFSKNSKKKNWRINSENLSAKKFNEIKKHLVNFVYLTPKIETLFVSGKQDRREFLDKIVCDLDFEHIERLNSYQKLLKERLLILQKYQLNKNGEKWLEIVENKIVELGVAIATARVEALQFFNQAILSFNSNFPKTRLEVIGQIEEKVNKISALELEKFYQENLEKYRQTDLASFRSNFGVHKSDFSAIFLEKNMRVDLCSTGEQKSILISLALARAKISAIYKKQPTILIFDEIVSHLDEKRRENLFAEIAQSSLQCFFSAVSQDLIPQKFFDDNLVEVTELN